jgi:predicted DNA-binding transcriptional regulator YafY
MDVLRHGENVEVMAPAELRRQLAARLRAAAKIYA